MDDDIRYGYEYFTSPLDIRDAFNYEPGYQKCEIISVVFRDFDRQYMVFYKKNKTE